jgi:hypothetical protein
MSFMSSLSGVVQSLHVLNEQRDEMSLLNCEKFTSQMYFHIPNVPIPPAVMAQEKRRMIAENVNKSLMYALMRQ